MVAGGSSHRPLPSFPCRSPKEVGDVIALSDISPSGAADHSQEPSPVGSRRGRVTPNLSRASSDADHGVSKWMLMGRAGKIGNGGGSTEDRGKGAWQRDEMRMGGEKKTGKIRGEPGKYGRLGGR